MWHGQMSRARRMLEYVMTTDNSILDPACPLQLPDQVIAFHRWLLYLLSRNNQHHTHQRNRSRPQALSGVSSLRVKKNCLDRNHAQNFLAGTRKSDANISIKSRPRYKLHVPSPAR